MARSSKKPSIGNVFDSDVNWTILMQNKELSADLMDFLIKEADIYNEGKCGYVYGGRCIIGSAQDDLSELIDEDTVDIVDPHVKKNKKGTRNKQGTYKTFLDWLKNNKPDEFQNTVYFLGDAHDVGIVDDVEDEEEKERSKKYVDIHWNCLVVMPTKREVWSYDPSDSEEKGHGYNFDAWKTDMLPGAMDELGGYYVGYTITSIVPSRRAQIFCNDLQEACDVFCQSWVVCFASAIMCGKKEANDFLEKINFEKYQNQPLKMWINCVLSTEEMSGWKHTLENPKYKLFRKYCRSDLPARVVELPVIKPEPEREKGQSKIPCIVSMIRNYADKN